MKKNKNKMIGMSTGFTLRSMKDLYCNNSIIKTGTMVAGVMLASCGNGNDNNNNNDDEKNKENNLQVNTLKDDVKKALAKELHIAVTDGKVLDDNDLQEKINGFKLTKDDINEDGTLKESGKAKIEDTKAKLPDPNDKTITLSNLAKNVKENLAGDLDVKDDKDLEARIAELKLNKGDIDADGKLNESGVEKKKKADNDKMAKALSFLEDKKENFINYLDDLDDYFGNTKKDFVAAIKDKKAEEIQKEVTKLCETYAKGKKDNDDVTIEFKKICKALENKKFIESKIAEFIDKNNLNKVNYKFEPKDKNTIKVTVKKEGKEVTFDLSVTTDELFSLKTTEKGNEVETKFYRITISIADDDAKKDELTKLLVPKTNDEIKTEAEDKIKKVLEASIKTNNGAIDVSNFKALADTLKKLVEATQKLLIGKYNDNTDEKFLADVKDLKVLHDAFDSKNNYENAIKTVFDEQLKSIKDALEKVTSKELDENIIIQSVKLALDDQNQEINKQKIYQVISALLNYDSKNTQNKSVIKDYIDGCNKAKIEVKNDGKANLELEFANGETVNEKGIIAFASQATVGGDQITVINNAFRAELQTTIDNLQFGIVNSQKTCKYQISNGYIDNTFKFENLKKIVPADIEKGLRTACGKDKIVITTVDDVKKHIVEPVMQKVFGNAQEVQNVFTKVNDLFKVKVGSSKTLGEVGITYIYKDNGGDADIVKADSNNTDEFGTATRLKTALLNIRDAIDDYNKNNSDKAAVKDFFKVYFGEVGTGAIIGMMDPKNVPADFKWMRLGKAVAKWVFSTPADNGYNDEQKMRQNYDAASKTLAMSILLNGVKVQTSDGKQNSTVLQWFNDNDDVKSLDLTNAAHTEGLGGTSLTDSGTANSTKIQVDFDNMIICNELKTKTSAAEQGNKDVIVIPALPTKDSWKDAQIVAQQFKGNFNGGKINSDFALLALFLGYFKKDGTIIDINVKAKKDDNQKIYNKLTENKA